jgi:hypothetical protein
MRHERRSKSAEVNRRPTVEADETGEFDRDFRSRRWSPTAVAELGRRMKSFATLGALVLLASGCSSMRPAKRGVATMEFERQENNGLVNLVPSTLVLSDHQKVTLSGGERAVVSVSAGSFYVMASSIDPYSPHSGERTWRSPRTRFQVVPGERLRVFVEPAASGSTYCGRWTLRSANQSAAPSRRPAWRSDGSANLSAIVAADRPFPAAVVELGLGVATRLP